MRGLGEFVLGEGKDPRVEPVFSSAELAVDGNEPWLKDMRDRLAAALEAEFFPFSDWRSAFRGGGCE